MNRCKKLLTWEQWTCDHANAVTMVGLHEMLTYCYKCCLSFEGLPV